MIWFTSDLHFGHEKIIAYSGRPFSSIAHMDQCLFANWNSVVHDHDLVYVLGDFTLGRYKEMEFLKRLRGERVLIQGNHDKFSRTQYISLGFSDVLQECVIKIGKTKLRLSHYPYKPPWWIKWKLRKKAKRYYDRRPPDTGWLLHGHTHSRQKVFKNMIHVGVDAWNHLPVSISQIESIVN